MYNNYVYHHILLFIILIITICEQNCETIGCKNVSNAGETSPDIIKGN